MKQLHAANVRLIPKPLQLMLFEFQGQWLRDAVISVSSRLLLNVLVRQNQLNAEMTLRNSVPLAMISFFVSEYANLYKYHSPIAQTTPCVNLGMYTTPISPKSSNSHSL